MKCKYAAIVSVSVTDHLAAGVVRGPVQIGVSIPQRRRTARAGGVARVAGDRLGGGRSIAKDLECHLVRIGNRMPTSDANR